MPARAKTIPVAAPPNAPTGVSKLYYGDNLDILRDHRYFPDACVDLIYLDPPFNSNRSYNVLFKDESGQYSEAQIKAFDDTWHWTNAVETYADLVENAPERVSKLIDALHDGMGENQMMAYLVMMTARLVELHRVLKATGSLYLHCDTTSSHYLKIVLDSIFGPQNYHNEISWKRTSAHNDGAQGRKGYGRVRDILLFYAKTDNFTWNPQHTTYDEKYVESTYRHIEAGTGRRYRLDNLTGPGGAAKGNPLYEVMGVTRYWRYSKEKMQKLIEEGRVIQTKPNTVPAYKRYLDEMAGVSLQDNWDDINALGSSAQERLGYPTQKPVALLKRIIAASSNPGDIVLDPFCGCGTAIAAAQELGRTWIGIDITHLAIALNKYRLADSFPDATYKIIGEPEDVGGARQLASEDRYQFQWWALSLIKAKPLGGQDGSKEGKKGSDKGIDGVITFLDDSTGKAKRVLVQVKSGKVNSGLIRDLVGTVGREGAAIGVFITLEPPTQDMKDEAASAGLYTSPGWGEKYRKVQIVTIDELLKGTKIAMPPTHATFKQAPRTRTTEGEQGQLAM